MIDLSGYRIVDLSQKMHPGISKVNGEYVHGKEARRLELREFIFEPDKMLMNWVDTESHIGTHVEGPSHHPQAERCLADLPIETFLGEAAVLKFDGMEPENGFGRPILPKHLSDVRKGDIVLMWSPFEGEQCPFISPQAASYLRETGIKMLGIEGIQLEAPDSMKSHEELLLNDIPIVEGLCNLGELRRERVLYVGLPVYIDGIDSSWTRAIAVEQR